MAESFDLSTVTDGFGSIENALGVFTRNLTAPISARRSALAVRGVFAFFDLSALTNFTLTSAYLGWEITAVVNPGGTLEVCRIEATPSDPDNAVYFAIANATAVAAAEPVNAPQATDLAGILQEIQTIATSGGMIAFGWRYAFISGTRQSTLANAVLYIEGEPADAGPPKRRGAAARFLLLLN